ncbi:MAG: hypothetical protein CMP67_00605 [Flavobacteriales bacterium]|nr:hypothetical protein [Flavobacteriales bacterium]|tara:strand:+ start:819 stop:1187 length:369 start_codon:yes stop_codon:yes gene_type:complete
MVIFDLFMIMKKNTIFGLITLLCFCCSTTETNEYIIPEEQLILMLCDFHIIDAAAKQGVISNNRNNLVRHKHYKSILKKHQIERVKFDSTIIYYSLRPEKNIKLYQKVEAELIKRLEKNQEE